MTNVDKDLFLYNFSLGLMAKDEGHYIREWLEYHLYAGVDHFFIYDNESTDNQKEVIQDYIDKGIVEYISWPGQEAQISMMKDAMKKARYSSRYFAMIDIDEFIVPYHNDDTIPNIVDNIFKDKPMWFINSIGLAWAIYGSNGNIKADYETPVLDRCPKRDIVFKRIAKYIMNPRKVKGFPKSPHQIIPFLKTSKYLMFNKPHQEIDGNLNKNTRKNNIILNHYRAKSKEEFQISKVNRNSILKIGRKENNGGLNFEKADKNFVEDKRAIEYRDFRKTQGYTIKSIDYDLMLNKIIDLIADNKTNYALYAIERFNPSMEELLVAEYDIKVLLINETINLEKYNSLHEQIIQAIKLIYDNKVETSNYNGSLIEYEIKNGNINLSSISV